jgi:superfamily II DNA or RNA helicase
VEFVQVDTKVKLDGVGKGQRSGEADFVAKQLERAVNTPERNMKIVQAAMRYIPGRKTLAFCAGVRHSVDLANAFRSIGVDARAVYGSMKTKVRREIIKQHRGHIFPILCNCDLLTTGYDDEDLAAIIMARPTKSKVLYLQELGRGLRPSPGKNKLTVLDVVDVAEKHQMAIGQELVQLTDDIEKDKAEPVEAEPKSEGGPNEPDWLMGGDLVNAPPGM